MGIAVFKISRLSRKKAYGIRLCLILIVKICRDFSFGINTRANKRLYQLKLFM